MNRDGIITAPVNIEADIATVLAAPTYDLGQLCSNKYGTINKYSKKKPVKIQGVDVNLTQPTDWWKGENKQCGLLIPHRTQTKACVDDFFDGSMKWGYDAPEPNSIYPARALDFDGYYHYAMNPISTETFPTDIWLEAGYGEHILRFSLDIATTGNDYNLGLSDIDIKQIIPGVSESIIDWYPGLIFKNVDKADNFAMTTKNTLSTGSFDITLTGQSTRLAGKWLVIPFLANVEVDTYNGDDKEGFYISADCDPLTVEVHAPGELQYGLLLAYWIGDPEITKLVGYQGFIINNNTAHTSKISISIIIYSTTDPGLDPTQDPNSQNERMVNIGTMVVPGNSEINFGSNDNKSYTDVFDPITLIAYDPNRVYWGGISVNGETPFKWHLFEQKPEEE